MPMTHRVKSSRSIGASYPQEQQVTFHLAVDGILQHHLQILIRFVGVVQPFLGEQAHFDDPAGKMAPSIEVR